MMNSLFQVRGSNIYLKGKVAEQEGYSYPVALYSILCRAYAAAAVTQIVKFSTHMLHMHTTDQHKYSYTYHATILSLPIIINI